METPKFTNEKGEFVSNYEKGQMGYLLELMEWVYHHNNMTKKDKLNYLLQLESMQEEHNKQVFPGLVVTDKWSDKLKSE